MPLRSTSKRNTLLPRVRWRGLLPVQRWSCPSLRSVFFCLPSGRQDGGDGSFGSVRFFVFSWPPSIPLRGTRIFDSEKMVPFHITTRFSKPKVRVRLIEFKTCLLLPFTRSRFLPRRSTRRISQTRARIMATLPVYPSSVGCSIVKVQGRKSSLTPYRTFSH